MMNTRQQCNTAEVLLCQACLSANRKMSAPGEYGQIYQSICLKSYPVKSNIYFCWECMATLRKIKKFKDNVATAQKILRYSHFSQDTLPKCLSTLSTSTTSIPVLTDNIVKFEEHSINIVNDIKIKVEDELENELCYNEDDHPEDIKVEIENPVITNNDKVKVEIEKPVITNHKDNDNKNHKSIGNSKKKERSKKYRLVLNANGSRAVERIKIGILDVPGWKERERNSNYYKNFVNKCGKCFLKLKRNEKLDEHEKTHHDKTIGRYACDICQTYFVNKSALRAHVVSHFYVHHCNVCGYECYSASNMNDHVTSHKKTVQCLDCHACFDYVREFFKHYRSMHRKYQCDHCNKCCKTKRSLEKHMRHHLKHECKECSVTFKRYWALRYHYRMKHVTASTEDAFCVPCDRQFANPLLYRRHLLTSSSHRHERSTGVKKEKVPCPECDNVYSRRAYMMNHYRHTHLNVTKFYCEDCHKYFLNRTKFVDHRRYNHEGFVKEKNKLCNICGKGFAENQTLANHMRTHSGERPFACTFCDSKFTQKQAMLSHVKFIHKKDRRKSGRV